MAFQVSPGVLVKEIGFGCSSLLQRQSELLLQSNSILNFVGEVTAINNETTLLQVFGKPNDNNNFESWFTAANFLQYGNALRVVRAKKIRYAQCIRWYRPSQKRY